MKSLVEKENRMGSRPGSRGGSRPGSRPGTPVRTLKNVKIDKALAAFKVINVMWKLLFNVKGLYLIVSRGPFLNLTK